jgi:hypothetical protein
MAINKPSKMQNGTILKGYEKRANIESVIRP